MTRHLLLITLATGLFLGTACSEDNLVPVTEEDSQLLFSAVADVLHDTHVAAFTDQFVVVDLEDFVYDCPEGGRIVMDTIVREDSTDLLHGFEGCGSEGMVLTGHVDYLEASPCDSIGFQFDMTGSLDVKGAFSAKRCAISAREMCGTISGTACGFEVP